MLYNIKWFFKNRIQRASFLWKTLLFCRRIIEKLERIKWHAVCVTLPLIKIRSLNRFESKVYSQNGEDGILQALFSKIGTTNKFCVEFGVENGEECNTRYLREKKHWTGLLMDGGNTHPSWIKREFISAENINELFKKYTVPKEFDLLSIDIDGNDYWVWKALDTSYAPRVVVIEYNAKFPPPESKTIAYELLFKWDGTDYFGASLVALVKLATAKRYTLVGCDRQGVNAFFVRTDQLEGRFEIQATETLYRPPQYGKKSDRGGWPASRRTLINV